MKILSVYTFDYLRRNRRSSLAIMVAILMTATMMSGLCGFLYNIYADNLSAILRENGNWHGELFDSTSGSSLSAIEDFDSIEAVLIKGDWKAAEIDDPRRYYLVWRDANAEYWNSMPEGDAAILEGRTPAQPGEIALSKQYFENHPELSLGDRITLPLGDRIAADGSRIAPQSTVQPGEQFAETGTATLKVVGKLDITTSSTVPAYTALGYLDPASIRPEDGLTIYLRFHKIGDTYKELPKIAAAAGYQQDEYGQYLLRYNTDYLTGMGVLSPEQLGFVPMLLANQMTLMFCVTGLLVMGLFVLIIHNAFSLSSSTRLTQLGIFASVGATPKQIKRSMVLEALLLTAIPLPLGLILGQGAVGLYIGYSNQHAVPGYSEPMTYVLGWQSLLPAILLTLCTVWWSALIPARRIARMSPITAIRQGGTEKLQSPGRLFSTVSARLFGIPGELAANALRARKKSYRTATVSLTLSFMTLACFFCINSASTASEGVYQLRAQDWAEQDIIITLHNVAASEDFTAVSSRIGSLDGMKSAAWYNTLPAAVWVPETDFSEAFQETGGFPAAEKYISEDQLPLLRNGSRRVGITLVGLDDETFASYCMSLDLDPSVFYEENRLRSILYHTVNDVTAGSSHHPVPIPLLKIKSGDILTLTEKTSDSYKGSFSFDTEITAITDRMPSIGNASFDPRYSAVQFLPMSRVNKLAESFSKSNTVRVKGIVQVTDPGRITSTRQAAEQICDSCFGSGDYSLFDEDEYYKNTDAAQTLVSLMFGFVAVLLAVIGLSNAWSTVRGKLNARRKEFAMLRSVGLTPVGICKMLCLEAILLGLTPILISLPAVLVLQGVFLPINEITFTQWLPYAPWPPLLLYLVSVLGVTAAAYITGIHRLLHENIIEAIRMDSD